MTEPIQEIEYRDHTIKVYHDDLNESPRETFDHFGTMVAFHSRHNLGDQHGLTRDEAIELMENGDIFYLPLYIYDHSGLGMSTNRNSYPYNCPWDSSHVGFIYVTKEEVREEYDVKRISPKVRERALSVLQGEVQEYHYYLSGQVYGYQIEREDGEEIDACWGFYGPPEDYMIGEAKSYIDSKTAEQEGLIYNKENAA